MKGLILIELLTFILLVLAFIENYLHQKKLKAIPIRILVNGTRGKTSCTKIIAKAFQAHGIRTVARTTGSEAIVIYPDGKEEPVIRKKKARITELISFIRQCFEQRAECIVVECMALGAENQRTVADKLIKPTAVAITNSYVDHIAEIGDSEEETLLTLAQSVPDQSLLFSPDIRYEKYSGNFHHVAVRHFDIEGKVPVHDDNLSLAIDLCSFYGIGENEVISSLNTINPDIGLYDRFKALNGAIFLPYFSVNDLHCMTNSIREQTQARHLVLIFNNRKDREYRIGLFSKAIKESKASNIDKIIVIGDYPKKVKGYLERKLGISVEVSDSMNLFSYINSATSECVFLSLGNIKGEGEKLVSLFINREAAYV